jgi:hypothetical protein
MPFGAGTKSQEYFIQGPPRVCRSGNQNQFNTTLGRMIPDGYKSHFPSHAERTQPLEEKSDEATKLVFPL